MKDNSLEPITQKILAHMRGNDSSFTLACRHSSKTESVIRFALEKVKEEDNKAKLILIVVQNYATVGLIQSNIIERERVDAIRGLGHLEFRNRTNLSIIRIVSANSSLLKGICPTLVIYDEVGLYENTLDVIAAINCPFSHYVTSYGPNNIFFNFIKSYPTLVINWRDIPKFNEAWVMQMSRNISASQFFNEYENGRNQ